MEISHAAARPILAEDPYWCIYALGDLDPRRQPHCRWFANAGHDAVALLYAEFDTPIVFASGADTAPMLEALSHTGRTFLQVQRHHLDAAPATEWKRLMHRLRLNPANFQPADTSPTTLLTPADEPAIRALYADGDATGETPDFFFRSQLDDATFYGVRLPDGSLAAAGGTHLFSQEESVGAIGNIYTHRQHRGKGYAAAITSAIAKALLARNTNTIALNVKHGNDAALRIYHRLGFRLHRDYWEAVTK